MIIRMDHPVFITFTVKNEFQEFSGKDNKFNYSAVRSTPETLRIRRNGLK